jgi:hypothetical protein
MIWVNPICGQRDDYVQYFTNYSIVRPNDTFLQNQADRPRVKIKEVLFTCFEKINWCYFYLYFYQILTAFNKLKIISEVARINWKWLKSVFNREDCSLECLNQILNINSSAKSIKFLRLYIRRQYCVYRISCCLYSWSVNVVWNSVSRNYNSRYRNEINYWMKWTIYWTIWTHITAYPSWTPQFIPCFLVGSVFLIFLVFSLSYYVSLQSEFRVVMSITISAKCADRLYSQLSVGGLVSYLLIFACLRIVVSKTYCVVFLLLFFVFCNLCCQFLWIVHFWLPLRYSLTFIEQYIGQFEHI